MTRRNLLRYHQHMRHSRALTTGLDIALAISSGAAAILMWRHFNAAPVYSESRPAAAENRQVVHPTSASFTPLAQSRAVNPASTPSAPVHSEQATATPFDRFMERLPRSKSGALLAKSMMRDHKEIIDAPDDPAWSRPMEQQIRDFIYSQPEASTLEISSLICRSTGCELQVLGPMNTSNAADGAVLAGWQAVANRLERSSVADWLGEHGTLMGSFGDRSLYITTLKRNAKRQ